MQFSAEDGRDVPREKGGEPTPVSEILGKAGNPIERLRRKLERGELPGALPARKEGNRSSSPPETGYVPRSAELAPQRPVEPQTRKTVPARAKADAAVGVELPTRKSLEPSGRYDFDLAEFPLFRFEKPKKPRLIAPGEGLLYEDIIRGRDGEEVRRVWKALAGPYGWGGATAQDLLFDLLQLYIAQGCTGRHIEFGSLRSLFRRRYGIGREPSAKDFTRLRRDLEILCGYRFETKNAFWDKERRAYVDMNWRLFDNVFYLKERPHDLHSARPEVYFLLV